MKEYYNVISPKCDSILHSSSPASAAAKAFTQCYSKKSKRSKVISVQRRSGNDKIMKYRVSAVKNPSSQMIPRGNKMIHFDYRTKVKSLNKSKK